MNWFICQNKYFHDENFVPLVIWLIMEYRMIGAALALCIVNPLYFLIVTRLIYQRLLRNEIWNWYWKYIFLPLFPAILVGVIGNEIMPLGESNIATSLYLLASYGLILFSSSLASEHVKMKFLLQLRGLWQK